MGIQMKRKDLAKIFVMISMIMTISADYDYFSALMVNNVVASELKDPI